MCAKGTDVNPDVGGLFIDDVGLSVTGNGLHTLLPLNRVICDRDEEGGRQQNQLEFPLAAVQKHCPATRGKQTVADGYCGAITGVSKRGDLMSRY